MCGVALVRYAPDDHLLGGLAADRADIAQVLLGKGHAAAGQASVGLHGLLTGEVAAPHRLDKAGVLLGKLLDLVHRGGAVGAVLAVLQGAVIQVLCQGLHGSGDGRGQLLKLHKLLLAGVAADQHALAVLDVAGADLQAHGHALHLPLGKLPAGLLVAVIQLDAGILADLGGQLAALVQHAGLVGSHGHDHDLNGRDGRGQDQAVVVAVGHDDGTHQTGRNAPAGLERVVQLVVAAGEGHVIGLAELVAEVVAGAALQGLAVLHHRLDGVGRLRTGKLLFIGLAALDNRDGEILLADVCEQDLAIPVVKGRKTDKEKFAGAEATYTIEAMMKDGKALQSGTSHYFGDKFSKAYDVTFTGRDNQLHHPFQTSWGVSTRLVGAIIMTHGDDDGLILPPAIAPIQVVIVPVAAHKPGVLDKCRELAAEIGKYARVKLDDSDKQPGWKFAQWEMKGVPVRLEVGPRDIENGQCVLVRRDTREKQFVKFEELATAIPAAMEALAKDLYDRALQNRENRTYSATTMDEVKQLAKEHTGFIKTMWCGDLACEEAMKADAGLSSRCMPFAQEHLSDVCPVCGKPAQKMVVWGVAY